MLGQLFKGLLPSRFKKNMQGQTSVDPLVEARRHIDEKRFDLARGIVDAQLETNPSDAEAWCLRGELRYWEKDDQGAVECFDKALRLRPELHRAHYGLSLSYHELGEGEKARLHAQYSLARDRLNGAYAAQVGLCELTLGNPTQALKFLKRAIRYAPGSAKAWNNLGIIHRGMGRFEQARADFRRAIELDLELEIAHRNLAQLCEEMAATGEGISDARGVDRITEEGQAETEPRMPIGDPGSLAELSETLSAGIDGLLVEIDRLVDAGDSSRALALAERTVAAHPKATAAVVKLSQLLEQGGSLDEALDVVEVALVHDPKNPQLLSTKGRIIEQFGRHRDAAELLERAEQLDPGNVDILRALAKVHFSLQDFARVEQIVSRIHALTNAPTTRLELATAQVNACHYSEALANYEAVLREHPEAKDAEMARNLGVCLFYLGRIDEALEEMNAAIAAEPTNAVSRFARALTNLLAGRYEQGWADYCYRFYSEIANTRLLPFPVWNGQPLEGKRILVIAEQGLGDQVMFASCLPDLLQLNPSVVYVEAHRRLKRVLARSFPSCQVIGTDQNHAFDWVKDVGEPDFYMHAGDLGRHFRRSPEAFPQHQGYLHPDPSRVEYWRSRLETLGPGPRIGVSWRGGVQMTRQTVRSLGLEQLAPLLRHRGAQFVSLQYGNVTDEVRAATDSLGIPLAHWPEAVADLDEFAALIHALDLVISVCNTTVHFAGALAKPVWVMTPAVPEWRYGLHTTSLPWYPSSVVFRQPLHGDWDAVIRNVKDALLRLSPAKA